VVLADTEFGAIRSQNARKHPAKSLWKDNVDSENMGRLGVRLRHRKNCEDEKETVKTYLCCHMLCGRYHLHVFVGPAEHSARGSMFSVPSCSIKSSLLHNRQENVTI